MSFYLEEQGGLDVKLLLYFIFDALVLDIIIISIKRDDGDSARADALEAKAKEASLEDCISIERNISYARILELFETSECGIHTMKDEHFGMQCRIYKKSILFLEMKIVIIKAFFKKMYSK